MVYVHQFYRMFGEESEEGLNFWIILADNFDQWTHAVFYFVVGMSMFFFIEKRRDQGRSVTLSVLIRGFYLIIVGMAINALAPIFSGEGEEITLISLLRSDNIILMIGLLTLLVYILFAKTPLIGKIILLFAFFFISAYMKGIIFHEDVIDAYDPENFYQLIVHWSTDSWWPIFPSVLYPMLGWILSEILFKIKNQDNSKLEDYYVIVLVILAVPFLSVRLFFTEAQLEIFNFDMLYVLGYIGWCLTLLAFFSVLERYLFKGEDYLKPLTAVGAVALTIYCIDFLFFEEYLPDIVDIEGLGATIEGTVWFIMILLSIIVICSFVWKRYLKYGVVEWPLRKLLEIDFERIFNIKKEDAIEIDSKEMVESEKSEYTQITKKKERDNEPFDFASIGKRTSLKDINNQSQSSRIKAIDYTRGLAIIFMIVIHNLGRFYSEDGNFENIMLFCQEFMGANAAPMFTFIAGMGLMLFLDKRKSKNDPVTIPVILRGIYIMTIAYIINAFRRPAEEFSFLYVFFIEILVLIGLSTIIMYFMFTRTPLWGKIAILIAFLFMNYQLGELAPVEKADIDSVEIESIGQLFMFYLIDAEFAVFHFIIYFIVGAIIADIFINIRKESNLKKEYVLFIILFLTSSIFLITIYSFVDLDQLLDTFQEEYVFMLIHLFTAILYFSLFLIIERAMPDDKDFLKPLTRIGMVSLSIYVADQIFGIIIESSELEFLADLTTIQTLIIVIGIVVLTFIIGNLWVWKLKYGPIEWPMRWLINHDKLKDYVLIK